MMQIIETILLSIFLLFSTHSRANSADDMDLVVSDLCNKEAAFLGEPSHGDGGAFEFKAKLVQRLIDECQYNAFFIESGTYDFLNFNQRLKLDQSVDETMLQSAIGLIWASTQEFRVLIPFLFHKAKQGTLTVA